MALSVLKTTLSRLLKTEVTEVGACVLAPAGTPELYLSLATNCMENVNGMVKIPTSPKLNLEQCNYLAGKLRLAVQSAQLFLKRITTWYSTFASAEDKAHSLEIFKLLFALGKEVECFIQGCCKDAWIQSAIVLTNVSEHITALGFDLAFCTIVFSNKKIFGAIPAFTVAEVARIRKAEGEIVEKKSHPDQLRLFEDVNAVILSSESCSEEWQLATFLFERLRNPGLHPSAGSLESNQSSRPEISICRLKQIQVLGMGSFGDVHKANWLGTGVARKTIHGPSAPDFEREVKILEGLCHPNIVSLLWYTRDDRKCSMIMELMDGDLYSLIEERLEECEGGGPPFNISESIHMMLQVAEGMLFLHEKQIVHRDLKSKNILVRRVTARDMEGRYVHLKVADFGLSRTKEKSMTFSNQTKNQGTTRWMAPEMITIVNEDGRLDLDGEKVLKYPFKVDVYSFGMVCFEILTGDMPFPTLSCNDVKKKVLGGVRPKLPDQCPSRLRCLIEACWSSKPKDRPRFDDICAELRYLKCALFMNSAWAKAPRCFNMHEIMTMTNRFSKDNILSWGALSMVYKGVMSDTGEVVAVERVFEKYLRDCDEFSTQMELLPGLHHNNLVGYVGFCYAKDETILVFEYMPNDSLDKWLSEDARKVKMTWPVRRNICLGVANGIHYLHSQAQPIIIHRHIKASNIFLDQTLEPRITGFQFALRVSTVGNEIRSPQQSVGILGYGGPECFDNLGPVSEKVDVCSFGALLFEIVSGRRNGDPKLLEDHLNPGEWAQIVYSEGKIDQLIDPMLNLQWDEGTEAMRILKIALLCVHPVVERRPDLALVVAMLQGNPDQEDSRLLLEHEKEHFSILVKMSKSEDQVCRQQAARKLRMLVAGERKLTELKEAGGITALVALLKDLDPNCQRDALVALFTLLPKTGIPVDQLPLQTVLDFLGEMWPIDVRNAAAGLLDLMANDKAVCTDIFIKTEGALKATLNSLKATLNSLKNIPDDPCGQRVVSGLLEMAKEHPSFRLQIAESGLCDLVKYMRHQSGNEFQELLIDMLVLFCRSGETCQDAVVKADGHVILLTSLQENNLKEKAAQGLLELLNNTRTRENVLGAGFVPLAVHVTSPRFACTDIALGLACICSTPEGLYRIYSEALSVRASLDLLEYCPEPKGKGAAALVIARLYPRLNCQEGAARQLKIVVACELFFKYLDPLDISYSKELLEALAAIAAETKGRQMMHEYRGHQLLINNLKSVSHPDVQGLILKILAEMSASDVSENGLETRVVRNIRNSFMEHRVADRLFYLFQSDEFNSRTEGMKYALILIRNLSLSGSFVCEQLVEQGAVTVLLSVLKRHENLMSVVAELAVKALEKFLDYPKGKQVFLKGGGIQSLVAVLKLICFEASEANCVWTIILIAVAKDPQLRKVACETIFECDILLALNQMIFNGETSRVRWQAAVLMKLLAMYGPTKEVCSAMKAKGCLDALISLRNVQHCKEMADDVLKFVSKNSRDCKRYIDDSLY